MKSLDTNVATRIMATVEPDWKAFWFNNGPIVSSLPQLADVLPEIAEETFRHHVRENDSDLTRWVEEVICDPILAQRLRRVRRRSTAARIIRRRVNQLTEAIAAARRE